MAGPEGRQHSISAQGATASTAHLTSRPDRSLVAAVHGWDGPAVWLAAVVALALLAIVVRGWWHKRHARRTAERAGLPEGRLHSVDPIAPRPELESFAQHDLYSARYGLSGRPDRIVRVEKGALVPVDVKKRCTARGGQPYRSHIAQVLAYALLVEDHHACRVPYAVIEYRDRSVQVPFDARNREWILDVISTVKQFKGTGLVPDQDHNLRQRCQGCGYRPHCAEAVH